MEIPDTQLMQHLIQMEIYLLMTVVIVGYKNLIHQDPMLLNMAHIITVGLLDGRGV